LKTIGPFIALAHFITKNYNKCKVKKYPTLQHKVGLQSLVSMLQMHQENNTIKNICMRKIANKKNTHTLRMKEKN
jgi:hypothetical protein